MIIGLYIMFCFVVISVSTFYIITFFNDPQLAFLVLQFLKLVCQYLPGNMVGGLRRINDNGNMGLGGVKIVIFVVIFFLNDPI